MDRGFNDDELADIMSEIENLEQEFTEEVEAKETNNVEPKEEPKETVVQEVKEEATVMEEVAEKPVEEVVKVEAAQDDNVHQLRPQTSSNTSTQQGAQTSMSFAVEGNMKLDLTFNISGKVVELNVNDQGLEISLGGGAKFMLPLEVQQQGKKAA